MNVEQLSDKTQIASAIAKLGFPTEAVIDGSLTAAADGKRFTNIAPGNGQPIGEVAAGNASDIDRAVVAARSAFKDGRWRDLAPYRRKAVLHRMADLMEEHGAELALLESIDTGKPITDAARVDVPLAIGTTRYYAEALDKIYGEVAPSAPGKLSYATHEPLGVVGAIVPWNFPLHMAMWKVAPALAMGNSVVLKPAEQSPMTALRLGQLALEAGLPSGVLNVVPGFGDTAGRALALHADVDMIGFTGSGSVGRKLMIYSAESNLKRVSLELGGKSPQIVFADCADLDRAAEAAAWGLFYNQGQVCTAASRLLVEHSIKDDFMERVIAVARTIQPGDPLDPTTRFGALVSERQMETVLDHIASARQELGSPVLGGRRVREESGGFFVEPTIFEVGPDCRLAREEVFGPVLGILTFADEAEALRLANDTIFGLAAGVWTSNIDRAQRMARGLHAGLVWVNGWDACDITMPFGGFKQSGFGRDRSLHALEKYADLKAVTFSWQAA
ncbi:MAG: aldehyde dehydrogenase [Sphingomonas sp.]|nr:aldehyde dehydrogenase [Sphingomonas sp.]